MVIVLSGLVLAILGGVLLVPKIVRIVRCRESTQGVVEDIYTDTGSKDRAVKVSFSYTVLGKSYKNCTRWTNYGVYRKDSRVIVKYDSRNPQKSYLLGEGLIVKVVVGFIFLVVGVGIMFVGTVVGF